MAMIDLSGSRQRAHRRTGSRSGFVEIEALPEFECGCPTPCLKNIPVPRIKDIWTKLYALSSGMKPQERENEFIIDLLFCPLTGNVISLCDVSLAQLLGISSRLFGRCRLVVQRLLARPELLSSPRFAPVHGMYGYRQSIHPINRVSDDLRTSISRCLDMALRADPSAADGIVTYKLYDPEVNTYGKLYQLVHRLLSGQLGMDMVGSLSSSSFQRLMGEYIEERDGRLSFARHDHNVCVHCRELEIAAYTLELELKLMSFSANPDLRSVREAQLTSAKEALESHVSLDRRVRTHLGRLVDILKREENRRRGLFRDSVMTEANCLAQTSQGWNSLPSGCGLLTHSDDMSAINIPHFVLDSVSELTRFAYSVNANVSAINGHATVFSSKQGEGTHDSSSVFEKVLLDHFLTCRGETIKIVYSDCASVGRSYASCVAVAKFLVDSGLCDVCLIGFMTNCHGKWHCDSLFGMLRRKALNTSFVSIDGLLDMFESIKRSGEAEVSAFATDPIASSNWVELFARAGYDTTPHNDFGFTRFNPHYACAASPDARSWIPLDLLDLLEPYLPREENCMQLCPWPIEDRTAFLPFEHRPVDVPAARARPRDGAKVREGARDGEHWASVIPPTQPFREGGNRVVSQKTAGVVGHNSSAFDKYAVELRSRNELVSRSWPQDMERPYVPNGSPVKAAPQNWAVRRSVRHFNDQEGRPRPQYPPDNLLNALDGNRPPHINPKHNLTETYR